MLISCIVIRLASQSNVGPFSIGHDHDKSEPIQCHFLLDPIPNSPRVNATTCLHSSHNPANDNGSQQSRSDRMACGRRRRRWLGVAS
jgi:hypothetical protein